MRIADFEILNHGPDHSDFFPGCGVAWTLYDDVATGIGHDASEAYSDAVEMLAQSGYDTSALPTRPRGIRKADKIPSDAGESYWWHVSIRVRLVEEEAGAPNLDAMPESDLRSFHARARFHPIQTGRALFPDRPAGYARATRDLANYAANVLTARTARITGNADRALTYEAIAERIYRDLPAFARW